MSPPRRWPRRVLTAAAVAAPLLAATGWVLAARGPATPVVATPVASRTATRTATGSGAPPAPVAPPPAPTADLVLHDATSPAARAEELLQALSERRAVALVARDEAALTDVHAPGSPSLASDRTLISGLRGARTRWEGLRLEVAEALFVSGSPSEAVVRARVDWTAYVVVTPAGARVDRRADVGRQLDFRLVRGPHGWRISAISAAPAT